MVYCLLSLEARNFIISGCDATLCKKIDDTLTFPTPYYFHFISFTFVQLTYLPPPFEKEMFHCYCDSKDTYRQHWLWKGGLVNDLKVSVVKTGVLFYT